MRSCTKHGFGMVASRWQLVNADVDDDQRHSTLLLDSPLGRLLEEKKDLELWSRFLSCCFALPLIDVILNLALFVTVKFNLSELGLKILKGNSILMM